MRKGPFVNRRCIRQRRHRHVGNDFAFVFHDQTMRVGRHADHREIQFPFLENSFGLRFASWLQHGQHTFLAFGEHHVVSRHVLFALWHAVEIEFDAAAALVGHFGGRRGEAGRAHILNGDDRIRRHQFETGFPAAISSVNGSPTCTVGRFSSDASSNSADAIVAP